MHPKHRLISFLILLCKTHSKWIQSFKNVLRLDSSACGLSEWSVGSWTIVHSPVFRCSVLRMAVWKKKKKEWQFGQVRLLYFCFLTDIFIHVFSQLLKTNLLLNWQVWSWIMACLFLPIVLSIFISYILKFYNNGHTHLRFLYLLG